MFKKLFCTFVPIAAIILLTIARPAISQPEFSGMYFHLYLSNSIQDTAHDLNGFKLDLMTIKNDVKWIRMPLADFSTYSVDNNYNVTVADTNSEADFTEAVQYANSHGFKILASAPTVPDSNLTKFRYKNAALHEYLADRYKNEVDAWIVFNEPNLKHFQTGANLTPTAGEQFWIPPMSGINSSYKASFRDSYNLIKSRIDAKDPSALVTTALGLGFIGANVDLNPTSYPDNHWVTWRIDNFLQTMMPYLDVIALQPYPVNYPDFQNSLNTAQSFMSNIVQKYSKPLWVTETGMHTGGTSIPGGHTVLNTTTQKNEMPDLIRDFRSAGVSKTFPFEMRDHYFKTAATTTNSAPYGLKDRYGVAKPAFNDVLIALSE